MRAACDEIASRIADARKGGTATANDNLPPPEWSPTIGQPEAANSDEQTSRVVSARIAGGQVVVTWEVTKGTETWQKETRHPDYEANTFASYLTTPANDNYTTLRAILDAAFNHAATGKGKERHARDLPFDKQPMLETTRLVGPGFPLGQAIKKAGEAAGMIERGELDAAEAECLGAINYLAGAVAWVREQATMRGKEAA
jgi:hypothetical protein